jgi:hypothetical protein
MCDRNVNNCTVTSAKQWYDLNETRYESHAIRVTSVTWIPSVNDAEMSAVRIFTVVVVKRHSAEDFEMPVQWSHLSDFHFRNTNHKYCA